MPETGRSDDYHLKRREVAKRLHAAAPNALIITGLGSTNWDMTAAGDRDLTFPLWGAMGGAVSLGLGLALAQPKRRVIVVTGDGEMLMGLGSLATVARVAPQNLSICVFDNERYGETGMQTTATAGRAALVSIARGCGIETTAAARSEDGLKDALDMLTHHPGPVFVNIKVRAEDLEFVLPPKDGGHLKDRFRKALLGDDGIV